MILFLPHASKHIPKDTREQIILNDVDLEDELNRSCDPHIKELLSSDYEDEIIIAPNISKSVLDITRFPGENDYLEKQGLGVIPQRTTIMTHLRQNMQAKDRSLLLNKYYQPIHSTINDTVEEELETYGVCVFLEIVSHTNKPLPFERDKISNRPAFTIGTDSYHSHKGILDLALRTFKKLRYSCEIDIPTSGCFVPHAYYHSNSNVMCLRISVNRSLYVSEATGEKNQRFNATFQALSRLKQMFRIQLEHFIRHGLSH